MIRFTMYVVRTVADAIAASRAEIFDFIVDETECEACGMVVGPIFDEFFPCVIIVDDDINLARDAWPICIDCASPLLSRREWIINLDL